jgi:hypothetical protein
MDFGVAHGRGREIGVAKGATMSYEVRARGGGRSEGPQD